MRSERVSEPEIVQPGSDEEGLVSIPATLPVKAPHLEDCFESSNISSLPASSISLSLGSAHGQEDGFPDEDVWNFAAEPSETKTATELAWETFYDQDCQEKSLYLSEAGPQAWDAAILACDLQSSHDDVQIEHLGFSDVTVISQGDGLKALFLLGMGSDSMLFSIDSQGNVKTKDDGLTVSGLSHGLLQSIASQLAATAQHCKVLETFVSIARADPRASVTRTAIAGSLDAILATIKGHLVDQFGLQRTILQLQDLFSRPGKLLADLVEMTEKLKDERRDKELLDQVFHGVQALAGKSPWARPIASQILARVSQPCLEAVSACIGLRDHQGTCRSIVQELEGFAEQHASDESSKAALSKKLPAFFGEEEANLILQSRQALNLLESRGDGAVDKQLDAGPQLEWGFDWLDIEKIQKKAENFSRSVEEFAKSEGLQTTSQPITYSESEAVHHEPFDPFALPDDEVKEAIAQSRQIFKKSPLHPSVVDDALEKSVREALTSQAFSADSGLEKPPMSLIPSLSFLPIISTQARRLSQRLLQVLFGPLQLKHHLAMQHAFSHFGSGTFAARLIQSLLSPDVGSTESDRKQRQESSKLSGATARGSGSMGLRLGTRTTWPPAGSELRLALDGILTDAYHDTFSQSAGEPKLTSRMSSSNPDDSINLLSFAIRPLTDTSPGAMDAILDPQSLSALDFLQISYKPPPLVDSILTPKALEAYDSSFAILLRMARILWTARQLVRADPRRHISAPANGASGMSQTRLHVEAHGLIEILASHFTTAINNIWTRFMDRVTMMEGNVLTTGEPGAIQNSEQCMGNITSLHALQESHEGTLRDIGSALLLRHRQRPARVALDAVFQLVLDLAGQSGGRPASSSTAVTLTGFRKHMNAFLEECEKLRNKERGRGDQGIASVESLLESLELGGWSRDTRWWSAGW